MSLIDGFIYWNVSPVMFHIPGTSVSLTWYGLMWALGLIISRQVGLYIFLKEDRYTVNLPALFLMIVVPAIVGARLGHFLFYDLHALVSNPFVVVNPPFHGLSSHGGVFGILIGVYIWCRRNHAEYLFVIDRLALVAISAGACIRFGNLMNSEIVGVPADLPWAFIFAHVDQLPRHPAQLYESVFYTVFFLFMLYVWHTHAHHLRSGIILGMILTILWTFRFVVESVKENQSAFEHDLSLNIGQILSIPYIMAGVALILLRKSKYTVRYSK
ncbi:prolipoprotein diacylglyceryl transferase [Fulvivirgaceae bacterium PWU5]|uniref:Phosphatidylglycerol--prolipoprotein diacylglyceryl transferase n=1 Tax=Dawidia cretensis TaxID=2782350 RepID=A0AAP2GNL5_9BACT|nr:prolipoprotein diacylglyceryl transferase [Dawidia cretensis]MBT1707636.1 prolipoprotein diacylglyceryl transferase [Dawidia cretensis]